MWIDWQTVIVTLLYLKRNQHFHHNPEKAMDPSFSKPASNTIVLSMNLALLINDPKTKEATRLALSQCFFSEFGDGVVHGGLWKMSTCHAFCQRPLRCQRVCEFGGKGLLRFLSLLICENCCQNLRTNQTFKSRMIIDPDGTNPIHEHCHGVALPTVASTDRYRWTATTMILQFTCISQCLRLKSMLNLSLSQAATCHLNGNATATGTVRYRWTAITMLFLQLTCIWQCMRLKSIDQPQIPDGFCSGMLLSRYLRHHQVEHPESESLWDLRAGSKADGTEIART